MAKISLKNIIGKKNGNITLLDAFIETTKADIRIEDENGNFLAGNANAVNKHEQPVQTEEDLLGWVKGDEKTNLVYFFVTFMSDIYIEK